MKRQLLLAGACAALLTAAPAFARIADTGASFTHEDHSLDLALQMTRDSQSFGRAANAIGHANSGQSFTRYDARMHHDLAIRVAYAKAEPNGF
ncbi:hypothetical protein G3580_13060 [Nitrogeniibacter mangrovi]|uniref:DUF4148 domain-containing protein n=1 Tax=Nitrogeniibacter mangrovi TaxID=2016596 RepID=A0A6C1B4S3_9RHOO|nr:hypothetical protein [Nitrogeniibacter mangrovi]QID18477.1 hypothetical protein G3580_13060 [Nitrogeniibacter mangrovi]